jgi:hypothetical protein
MHQEFETSEFFEYYDDVTAHNRVNLYPVDSSTISLSCFASRVLPCFSSEIQSFFPSIQQTLAIIQRSFTVKFREFQNIKRAVGSSAILGLLIGYMYYQNGDWDGYCLNLIRLPYDIVANCTSSFFLGNAFLFVQQVLFIFIFAI